jgi:SAM-dependent methyltransferase
MKQDLLNPVAEYYAAKLAEHGPTPQGVDWNSPESQELRFLQLSRVMGEPGLYSVNDIGCGYGHLFTYLESHGFTPDYLGVDVSCAMIKTARARAGANARARFLRGVAPDRVADYALASGIFNVRLNIADVEWMEHILASIDMLNQYSTQGFSFNCLTRYSDADRMRPDLFYADPCVLFDYCKRKHSKNVALLHDYGLYEFTIIVRKGSGA